MHRDFRAVSRFNALFVRLPPALAFGTAAEGIAVWNGRATNLARYRWLSWSVAVLVVGWSVLRNL